MKFILVVIINLCSFATYAQQHIFNCEENFLHPIKIPTSVLKQLQITEGEKLYDRYGLDKGVNGFASVKGTYIYLNKSHKKSILVEGVDGANNVGFWIFELKNGVWKLVFQNRGITLTLKKQENYEHSQIVFSSCWAAGCHELSYKYNGLSYYQYSCVEVSDEGRKPCK